MFDKARGLGYCGNSTSLEFLEQRYKVEVAADHGAEGGRVETQGVRKSSDFESGCGEVGIPLRAALVVVGERDAVGAIADPVHEAEGGVIDGAFTEMIFQEQ